MRVGGAHATATNAAYGLSADDLKVWFGIVTLVVVELGLITPPVGLNVFIIAALSQNLSIIPRQLLCRRMLKYIVCK